MHIHHYTLKQIVTFLRKEMHGAILGEIFTQDKDELVIGLGAPGKDLWLRVSCQPVLQFVWPVREYRKAKRNVLELWTDWYGAELEGVECLEGERVIVLSFAGERQIILKMHGNQSNVLRRAGGQVIDMFRQGLQEDLGFQPVAGKSFALRDALDAPQGDVTNPVTLRAPNASVAACPDVYSQLWAGRLSGEATGLTPAWCSRLKTAPLHGIVSKASRYNLMENCCPAFKVEAAVLISQPT